jgi:hypothetical protein
MTLGISVETPEGLAQQIYAAHDGRDAARRSRVVRPAASLEVRRTIDPSHGVNAMGGSSYTPGLPLLPSNAGLAGTGLSNIADVRAGALTYYEAMGYTPPVSQTPIPLTKALEGAEDPKLTLLNAVLIIGAGLAAWWLMRKLDGEQS